MILIGLGSSLPFCGGSPQETLERSIRAIGCIATVTDISRFYETPAWPDSSDPGFVNAAIALTAAPPPLALLSELHCIEAAFGRRRRRPNEPRTLDLDLLAYGQEVMTGALTLPHPGLAARGFVLAPLADIAPDFRPPGFDRNIRELLSALGDPKARPLP